MTIETKTPISRKSKQSYKSNLSKAYEEYSGFIVTLNSSMQSRLDRIYSAFSGNYSYVDSHSGKTVNARTYKKRLFFADKEIEALKRHLALQYKYGTFSEESKSKIEDYLSSLYSAAIKNNNYLKDKYIRSSVLSEQVRNDLHSLGPSIEDKLSIDENSRAMRAPTGYTEMFKEENSTISTDAAQLDSSTLSKDVAALQERTTSSRLYDRLITIDAENAKLSDEDLPAWPFSRDEELMLRQQMKNGNKPKRKGILGTLVGVATLALAGAAFFFYSANKMTSPYSAVPSPDISHINPDRLAEPADNFYSVPLSVDPNKVAVEPEDLSVKVVSRGVDKATIEYEAKLRVAEAKKQIALEKSQNKEYTSEQLKERSKLAWEKVRQYEAEIKQQEQRKLILNQVEQQRIVRNVESSKNFNWRKSFDAYWQRKSDERAAQNVVVKIATFHDGKVDVSFPLKGTSYAYSQ